MIQRKLTHRTNVQQTRRMELGAIATRRANGEMAGAGSRDSTRPFVYQWRSAVFNCRKASLSSVARLVLLALAEFASANGDECHPSISNLADMTALSAKTVGKVLVAAEKAGWLTRRKRQVGQAWRRTYYTLILPPNADTTTARCRRWQDRNSDDKAEVVVTARRLQGAVLDDSLSTSRELEDPEAVTDELSLITTRKQCNATEAEGERNIVVATSAAREKGLEMLEKIAAQFNFPLDRGHSGRRRRA
jgi:DNA-binding MarR family transcriptional regulator